MATGIWSWPVVCAVAAVQAGLSLTCLLVEIQRRRSLLGLVEKAPDGTTVVMDATPEFPAIRVRVGQGTATRSPWQ
jgi:hypothetical protein